MKRSRARWTTAIAATALLAVPASGRAQSSSASPQQPNERPAATDAQQSGSAHEHIRQAAAALNDIPAASLTGVAKARVAELKRHVSTLEQAAATAPDRPPTGAAAASGNAAWSTEVAAADTILTELLGGAATTGATEPTGTAGTTATTARRGDTSTPTLDETTRAKLQETRTHLTAFAATMRGGSATPSADDPAAAASASGVARGEPVAASTPPSTSTASTAPAQDSPTAQSTTTQSPETATQGAQPGQTVGTAGTTGTQPPDAAQPGTSEPDPVVVKRHLTAARDSLSQLTQLPAASQLTGDARTQVSQLISNFNELITTNTEWRASFAKVQANLNTLLGDQRADESAAPTAGAAGAVGTAGAVTIDPAIRAKLVEFRAHLTEFEKAASGTIASNTAEPGTAPAAGSPAATASPSEPAATTATNTTGAAGTSTQTATGTSGRTTASPASAGTAASAEAEPAQAKEHAAAGHSEALKHIDAIEAILNGQDPGSKSPAGSTARGTSGTATSQGSTLTAAQIAEIKTHLDELRKAISQSGR